MGSESVGKVRQAYLVTLVPVKFSLVKLSFLIYFFFPKPYTHVL